MQLREWTVNALSVELRRDRRLINKVIANSGIKPTRENKRSRFYRIAEIVNALCESGELNLEQERAKLAKEQREKVRLQNKEKRGELVPVNQVTELWTKVAIACRSKLLALPNKMAAQVFCSQSVPETQEMLRVEVYAALNELSEELVSCADRE
ncbi:MAG: hypothetical protein KJO32_12870, partial [Deltaproteobacteria bacterium]|nr:hypothetical protein [Deltaproteobacteria bacterium]